MGTLENLYRSSRNHDQLMSSILMETIVYKTRGFVSLYKVHIHDIKTFYLDYINLMMSHHCFNDESSLN